MDECEDNAIGYHQIDLHRVFDVSFFCRKNYYDFDGHDIDPPESMTCASVLIEIV